MTFKKAYESLKKLPSRNFLRECYDLGDLWEFVFISEFLPEEDAFGGGGHVVSKKTGEILPPLAVYADPRRTGKPTKIPVPRFAYEGWDYYDEKAGAFKIRPNAPDWAKREFAEFYETNKFDYESAPATA